MKQINILLLFLLFTQFCVSQTINEKYEFTLKAVEKNNKEGVFLYMYDILNYEKENGIDTNYLKTLEYFSSFFYSISDFENILKLDEVILETKEKIFGINNNEYILTLENIAHDYVELGNYVKALETNNTIIKNLKKNNEINSGRIIYTLSKTASNNYYLGNYSEALKINLYCKENLEKTNQKQTDLYLEVLGNLANNYSKLSNESKSIEFNLECLFLTEKIKGKSNRQYYVTLGNLAGNYANIGNYKKAIEEVNKCLILIMDNKNIDSNLYYNYKSNLASYYIQNGDLIKALEINLDCLKYFKNTFGIENYAYIVSLSNTAENYSGLGKYHEALELSIECLKIGKKVLGENHLNYLIILGNLAGIYKNLGKYQNALDTYFYCLKIEEKIFGDEHTNYLKTLNNLGTIYLDLGNYQRAIELNLQCLKTQSKIFGNEHPDYLITLGNLAVSYSNLGNYQKALDINLECLKTKEKIFGVEHPDYLITLGNLAVNYSDLGNYQKALDINLECQKTQSKIFGNEHPDYLITLGNLAVNYSKLGNDQKALEINLECQKIQEKILGIEHLDYLATLGNLAVSYSNLGNYQKALDINLECLKTKEKIFGVEHPDYLRTLGNLAVNYSDLGNYQKAIELNLRCLKTKEEIFGVEHPDYLSTMGNLAQIHSDIGDYKKGIEINLQCLKTKEKIFGVEHPDYLLTLGNIGTNYSLQGFYSKALEINLECLKIKEKILGKEHPDYLITLGNVAHEYLDSKNYTKSDSCFLMSINQSFKNLNLYGLNEKEQNNFKELFNNKLTVFINYSQKRYTDNQFLSKYAFHNYLNINGIISNQSAQLESQIRTSKDTFLIHLFEKWQINKLQLLKYYELTKPELEKRGINIAELEEEINEQERVLSRGSEMFSEMKKTYVLSDIQQQLKEDEAYVDIVRLPYYNFNTNVWSDTIRYLVYIITKDTKEIPTTVLLENGNQLEEEIASYYAENTFGKSKREKDSISYAYFWKPIYKELSGKRKVYLSSGGVFNNINVQTLFNPSTNKYVSEELEVQLVNNGRTFIKQKTKKPQVYTNNTATFIGYPNFNGTLSKGSINEDAIFATTREFSPMLLDTLSRGANVSPLPGTQKEVETIGELLKTKKWDVNVLTENNASEEEIKKVESPRVLHIATHGYFLKQTDNLQKESGLRMMGMDTKRFVENPLLRSGLLLSGANKTLKGDTTKASENGILTAYEAAYLHLQGTELVVLSACETGKGELKNGEGVYGLRKSFSDAGAKNIIMSLWKVDDKVTQEFMTSFYTNWSTGITIREAFNKTQQSIKALYPQPYYWGAFVLVGE